MDPGQVPSPPTIAALDLPHMHLAARLPRQMRELLLSIHCRNAGDCFVAAERGTMRRTCSYSVTDVCTHCNDAHDSQRLESQPCACDSTWKQDVELGRAVVQDVGLVPDIGIRLQDMWGTGQP